MDRLGDMGNLETKTKAELLDLLARQEKLLVNKKRLSMLPDKGQKVQLLADRLRELIAKHEAMVNDAADLLEKMDIGAPQGVPESPPNAFLKTEKAPFQPFRTLHSDRIPEGLERPLPTPPSSGSTPMRGVQDRPPEMSAVAIPPLKHPGTQYMDVKEAAELLEKQRSKVQALQAAQAAERLSERLHIQMGAYKPDSPGRYRDRDRSNDNSEDEDTDDDEVDADADDDDDESDDSREIPQQKQHVPNG